MPKKKKLFGPNSIEDHLSLFLKPIVKQNKKEFSILSALVKNWQSVIGDKYHKLCYPKSVFSSRDGKISLIVAVANPAIGFFLKNNSPLILERIASFYGYKMVSKIVIKQEPQDIRGNQSQIKLSEKQERYLKKQVADIEDKDLAESLSRLGSYIIGKPI